MDDATDLSPFVEAGEPLKTTDQTFEDYCQRMDIFSINQWVPFWMRNAATNYQTVPTDQRKIKTISHLKNIHWGREAVVLASGPSLDDNLQYLHKFKGLIFAGNSTINPCIANGIKPDWVHVLDADEYVPKQFEGIDCSEFKAILPIYLAPTVIPLFNPDLIWWMSIYDPRHWLTKDGFHHLFPNIDALLASSSCPTAMVRLAHWMGIRKIYVVGNDFGFINGRKRCSIYARDSNGGWGKIGEDEFAREKGEPQEMNGVMTTLKLRVAHRAFVDVVRHLPELELIDCSRGIITEFPKKDFREVVGG